MATMPSWLFRSVLGIQTAIPMLSWHVPFTCPANFPVLAYLILCRKPGSWVWSFVFSVSFQSGGTNPPRTEETLVGCSERETGCSVSLQQMPVILVFRHLCFLCPWKESMIPHLTSSAGSGRQAGP